MDLESDARARDSVRLIIPCVKEGALVAQEEKKKVQFPRWRQICGIYTRKGGVQTDSDLAT